MPAFISGVRASRGDPVPFHVERPATHWREDAVCLDQDPDMAFPNHGGSKEAARRARELCGPCTVTAECLSFAFENDERYGIWGGTTERTRNAMWKRAQREHTARHDQG